jgi:hypothetical protein
MSIRIRVSNLDSRNEAIVKVQSHNVSDDSPNQYEVAEIRGGETHEILIHSGQYARVTEIKNG